jgi:hypothetical protein
MADGEDFDPKEALPQDAAPGQAKDMSQQGNLRKAWDAWTSRPENNAALINFGLNLMQPIQPGQSKLGHWAESVGAGAEASGRNVTEQRKQEAEDVEQEQKQEALDIKERETDIYGKLADTKAAGGGASKISQALRQQAAENADFSSWLTGKGGKYTMEDNTWAAVQRKFPQIKTKADLYSDPVALRYAKQLHHQSFAPSIEDMGGDIGATGGAAGGQPTTVIQNGITYTLGPDGKYH